MNYFNTILLFISILVSYNCEKRVFQLKILPFYQNYYSSQFLFTKLIKLVFNIYKLLKIHLHNVFKNINTYKNKTLIRYRKIMKTRGKKIT